MKAKEYRLFVDTVETAVRRLTRRLSKAGYPDAVINSIAEEKTIALITDLVVEEVCEAFDFEDDHALAGCSRCE